MNVQETLSALMDDACEAQELDRLLAGMAEDSAAMRQWSQMCAQRDAREGTRIATVGDAWMAGLMSEVRAAPVPLASAHPKVASLAARRRPALRWRPVAGLAAAASVAVVAVALTVGVDRAPPAGAPAAVPVAAPAAGLQLVANTPAVPPRVDPAGTAQPLDAEDTWLLNNYLLEHNNALASQGVGGTLRYARFAAHTSDGARPMAVSAVEDAR
jgi:negative regulator of sigma E activity